MGNLNCNFRITGELFNLRSYSKRSNSAELALGGTCRLRYVDGTIFEIPIDNHRYAEWKVENMLIMSWIYHSMEMNIQEASDIVVL